MSAPTIRDLCQRATPGPWRTYTYKGLGPHDDEMTDQRTVCTMEDEKGRSIQVASVNQIEPHAEANAQLIARLSPEVVLRVVEALTDAHLYIDDGLEGSPAKRKAMLLQIESALHLLNATAQPTGE